MCDIPISTKSFFGNRYSFSPAVHMLMLRMWGPWQDCQVLQSQLFEPLASCHTVPASVVSWGLWNISYMKTAMSLQGQGKATTPRQDQDQNNIQDSPQQCDALQCFSKTHLIPVAGKDAMIYTFPTNLLDAQKSSMCIYYIGMICPKAAQTFNHIEGTYKAGCTKYSHSGYWLYL